MESSSSVSGGGGVLLTTADLTNWQKQIEAIEGRMRALAQERDFLAKRLEMARQLVAFSSGEGTSNVAALLGALAVSPSSVSADASWRDAILIWLTEAPLGLTYAELRSLIDQSPLVERFNRSEKGYYNAISRLAAREELIKHNGRLFTPQSYANFKRAVREGEVEDEKPVPTSAHSPMGEAILRIVAQQPGILGKEIISELRKDPEFNATLTPHTSGAYNIMARLIKRHQIIRRDDGKCFPGTKFPKHLSGVPLKRDEALSGNAASASIAGEGWTPSPFRQQALRLAD